MMRANEEHPPSIRLEAEGRSIELRPGEILSVANSITYSDTTDDSVALLEREIRGGVPWRDAVHRRFLPGSPWLDRCVTFSDRDLFYRGLKIQPADFVLDIGSGWGQLAIPLARRAHVCALEPKRAKILFQQAVAIQEGVSGALWLINADYRSIVFQQSFQFAILNGVLEWVGLFSPGDPYEAQIGFLQKVRRDLAPDGLCVIGIENRIGLKYLLGALDDHTGVPLISVYDRHLAASKFHALTGRELRTLTYTHAEYQRLLGWAGFDGVEFFAAFPDYKVPSVVFPMAEAARVNDFFLSGGFIREHSGYDGLDLTFQDELQSLYRSLAELGIAHHFAPSYYIVAHRRE